MVKYNASHKDWSKVKNSLKLFNSEIIDNLNLTKTTKNYLFYN